ncbi:MAG: 3-deoxy-D-manno-octulosonate 8-phosphate phosphatase [Bacteroidia bacterium]
MSNEFLNKLHHVNTFMLDVDGVLTDGSVLATDTGEQLRVFNIKDGYALQLAVKKGYRIVIITGGKSPGVIKRLQGLGITDIYAGVANKLEQFNSYIKEHQMNTEHILYMGDDIPDRAIMKQVGVPCCPKDAVGDIQQVSLYTSPKKGGKGCVRDVLEQVMKIQGKWNVEESENLIW